MSSKDPGKWPPITNVAPATPKKPKQSTKEEATAELKQAIEGSGDIMATATTVFPFTLFPDTVTLDRTKLTITKRNFFFTAEVITIRVADLLNVQGTVGPLFGSLKIVARIFSDESPYQINYLWREDAQRLGRIIQGYIIALQQDTDCSKLSTRELVAMLDNIGNAEQQT